CRWPCRPRIVARILAPTIGGSMQFDLTPAQRALQAKARELARGPITERAAEIDRREEITLGRLAQSASGAHGARCAHVHDRRRDGTDLAHCRRLAAARAAPAADPGRVSERDGQE